MDNLSNQIECETRKQTDDSDSTDYTISKQRLIEFVHDLQEAIQNGKFHSSTSSTSSSINKNQFQNFLNQSNIDNLSNQTFTYIVNWLKEHQKNDGDNCDEKKFVKTSDPIIDNSQSEHQDNTPNCKQKTEMFDYINEIKYLRTKLKQYELDKENLIQKINELQEENIDLKTRLINLSHDHQTTGNNYPTCSYFNENSNTNDETEKLKKILNELTRLNDDKDRKIDELTKQVIRFKRIQEIVLSAQTSNQLPSQQTANSIFALTNKNLNNLKNGMEDDIDFDSLNSENSLLNGKNETQKPNNNGALNSLGESSITLDENKTRGLNLLEQFNNNNSPENQKSNSNGQNIINSASLTSSISSSSSSTSATSSTNSSCVTQNTQTQLNNQLQAPLATISEFTSYSSCSTVTLTTPNKANRQSYEDTTFNTLDSNKKIDLFSTRCESETKSPKLTTNKKINEFPTSDTKIKTKSSKYSSAITLSTTSGGGGGGGGQQTKSVSPSPVKLNNANQSSNSNNKSIRQFFGKLIRTSLVNINDSTSFNHSIHQNQTLSSKNNNSNSTSFKRGGFLRSTANARLQSNSNLNLDTLTFSKWSTHQVCEFLHKNGFEAYFSASNSDVFSHKWIKNGLHLLQATQYDYEKELGIKNLLHRKKLSLLLQSLINNSTNGNAQSQENQNLNKLDQYWVLKWLDDIGLPQYKDIFNENMVDGRMLMHINNEDFQHLNINSELHFLSIKRAIHVLRLNNFDPQCLRRRPSGDDNLDKSEVMLWTNHRVMEWLRSIDLSEYAPNLRGSGVHGGLMVFEARFNSTLLADILSIPTSKTLLRRHLTTLFNDLIGSQMFELKKKAESQPGYQQLSASSKVKHIKKNNIAMGSLFSSAHKRTKSQDSRDFLSITPIVDFRQDLNNCAKESTNGNTNSNANGSNVIIGQSATLPISSSPKNTNYNSNNPDELMNSFKSKLSILTHENVPTSIV